MTVIIIALTYINKKTKNNHVCLISLCLGVHCRMIIIFSSFSFFFCMHNLLK